MVPVNVHSFVFSPVDSVLLSICAGVGFLTVSIFLFGLLVCQGFLPNVNIFLVVGITSGLWIVPRFTLSVTDVTTVCIT